MKITLQNGVEVEVREVPVATEVKEAKPTPGQVRTVRIETVRLERDPVGQLFARTPGSPTQRVYRIYEERGIVRCECPAFVFQRGTLASKTCKHIEAARLHEEVPASWEPKKKKA